MAKPDLLAASEEKIKFLEKELYKQKKINSALKSRVKDNMQLSDNNYARFQKNILLEKEVEKRTENLQRDKEKAQKENMEKSDFFSSMSHELRSPMHGILSFSQLGSENHSTIEREKMGKYFRSINQSGTRLLRIIDDLLDLAKFESGKFEIDTHENNLSDITESVIQENIELLHNKDIEIEFINKNSPKTAEFDADRATQIIQNLLSNAIKFSPNKSKISLTCEADSIDKLPAIKFSIADQGKGIPEKEHELIFEKYIQSSNNSNIVGSTGLGLPICKELVNLHNGLIWVENNKDQGACFSFLFPLQHVCENTF